MKKSKYFVDYFNKFTKFKEVEIFKTKQEFNDFTKQQEDFVFSTFESQNSTAFEAYQKLSSEFLSGIRFSCLIEKEDNFEGFLKNTRVEYQYDVDLPKVFLFTKNQLFQVPKDENMIDWISEKCSQKLIFELGSMNFKDSYESKKPTVIWFLNETNQVILKTNNDQEENLSIYQNIVHGLYGDQNSINTELFSNFAYIDG
jgi:hypothetical protein